MFLPNRGCDVIMVMDENTFHFISAVFFRYSSHRITPLQMLSGRYPPNAMIVDENRTLIEFSGYLPEILCREERP